jgi:hypothetical protein
VAEKSSTSSSFSSDLGQDLLEDYHHRPQHIDTANINNSKPYLHEYNNYKTKISFLSSPSEENGKLLSLQNLENLEILKIINLLIFNGGNTDLNLCFKHGFA